MALRLRSTQRLANPNFGDVQGLGMLVGSSKAVGEKRQRRQGLFDQLMQDDPLQQAQAIQALGVEDKNPALILQGSQLLQDENSRLASNELNRYLEVIRNPASTAEQVDSAANSAANLANTSRYLDVNTVRGQLTQARNFQADRVNRLATSFINSPSYSEQGESAFIDQYGPLGKTALTAAKVTKASGEQALQSDADARLLKQNEPLILKLSSDMQQLAMSDFYSREAMDRLQADYNDLISETPGYRERFASLSSIGLQYRDDVLKRRDDAVERQAEREAAFVSTQSDRLFLAFRDTEDPTKLLANEKERQLGAENLSDQDKFLIEKAFDDAETRINEHVETVQARLKQPKDRLTAEELEFFKENPSVFPNYKAIESGLGSPNVYVRNGAVKSFRLVYDQSLKASTSDRALQFKAEQQAARAIELYLLDDESQRVAIGDDIYDVIEDFRTGSDAQQKTFTRFEEVLTQKFRENPQAPIRQTVEQAVAEIPSMESAINRGSQVNTSRRQQAIEAVRAENEPAVRELMEGIVSERYPDATDEERLEYLADPSIRFEAEINLEAYFEDRKRQQRLQNLRDYPGARGGL